MSKIANEKMRATAVEERYSVWEGNKKAAAATAASPSMEASTADALATPTGKIRLHSEAPITQ